MIEKDLPGMFEAIQEHRHIHKLQRSDFNITAPTTTDVEVVKNSIIEKTDGVTSLVWCKFTKETVPRIAWDEMCINFQKEVCDLKGEDASDVKLMLAATELNPGFKKSNRWRWIGAVSIEKGTISWAWIHPYFRGEGILTALFLNWYIYEYGRLVVQPPLTKKMQRCITSTEKLILSDDVYLGIIIEKFRANLLKIGANQVKVKEMDNNTLIRIMGVHQSITTLSTGKCVPTEKMDELLVILVDNFEAISSELNGKFTESEIEEGKKIMEEANRQVSLCGKVDIDSLMSKMLA